MLTYPMAERNNLPLHEYLFRCIRSDIQDGTLKPGDKLPSKRALAAHLNLSVTTVQHAYEHLQSEGYVYSVEKKGFYVQKPEQAIPIASQTPAISLPPAPSKPRWFADFTGGEIPEEHFPMAGWAKSVRKALRGEPADLLQVPPTAGLLSLRQAIADHLNEYRGIVCSPESILLGAGADNLYDRLIQLLGRDLNYATENPGYRKFRHILQASRLDCIDLPIDSGGLSFKTLQKSEAQVVHLSPSHQFPTGIVMPAGRRRKILAWAAEAPDRWIIEDDYDCELRLQGRPVRTMFSMDENRRVIYMNTFSRTLAPSLRVAFMVLPPELLQRQREHLSFYSCPVPTLHQIALADFMSNGSFGRHINRMRTIYRQRRLTVQSLIRRSPIAAQTEIIEHDAGLHFLLEVKTKTQSVEKAIQEIVEEGERRQIRLACWPDYRLPTGTPQQEENRFFILINYSGLGKELCEPAVERLVEVVQSVLN